MPIRPPAMQPDQSSINIGLHIHFDLFHIVACTLGGFAYLLVAFAKLQAPTKFLQTAFHIAAIYHQTLYLSFGIQQLQCTLFHQCAQKATN